MPHLPAGRFTNRGVLVESRHNRAVFLATDLACGEQLVAVKLLARDAFLASHVALARGISNIWALSFFQHPHILHLREVVLTPDGDIGLVMALVPDGLTLGRLLDDIESGGREPFPIGEARRIFQQLVAAVGFSHRLGESDVFLCIT